MANHVHFNINLDLDDGQVALLKDIMDKVETEQGEMKWKTWSAEELPIYSTPYDEENWYDWSCDNIGAKWIQIDEYESDYITGYSAWSPANPMVESLVQYIFDKVGGEVKATMTYEDEFRNFIGKSEFWIEDGQCEFDIDERDGEEINDLLALAFGKNDEWFQSDEFDWWEEYELKQGSYAGEKWEPQQYADELVYQFFDSNNLEIL